MRALLPILGAALLACVLPGAAQALLGGTPTLTSKPGVTGDEVLALTPARRAAVIAKTVREGSFVSRGACAPGESRLLARRKDGAAVFRMDCIDAEAQVVVMPTKARGPATVLSCRRSKALLGVDCAATSMRSAGR